MDELIIDNLIKQGESERLVFVSYLDKEILAKEICALLNTKGGDIIVGLNKDKSVIHFAPDIQKIKTHLSETISPSAPYSINVFFYKKEPITFINVWPGGSKPYSYKGIIYTKDGRNTLIATNEQLGLLNTERKNSEFHWERQSVLGAEIEDLDSTEIHETLNFYLKDKPELGNLDTEDFLSRLGLMKGGSLTNAAIVLFGNNPTRFSDSYPD